MVPLGYCQVFCHGVGMLYAYPPNSAELSVGCVVRETSCNSAPGRARLPALRRLPTPVRAHLLSAAGPASWHLCNRIPGIEDVDRFHTDRARPCSRTLLLTSPKLRGQLSHGIRIPSNLSVHPGSSLSVVPTATLSLCTSSPTYFVYSRMACSSQRGSVGEVLLPRAPTLFWDCERAAPLSGQHIRSKPKGPLRLSKTSPGNCMRRRLSF